MRRIIMCLIAASLFAGSSAWAAAGDDDKDARSGEKSRASAEKKATETPKPGANPGKPATANTALESEVQQLKQLVQEQADRLRGLQQRLADVEGEVAGGKPAATSSHEIQLAVQKHVEVVCLPRDKSPSPPQPCPGIGVFQATPSVSLHRSGKPTESE